MTRIGRINAALKNKKAALIRPLRVIRVYQVIVSET